jgi:exodeoxyribonuclease V alpha subunit
MSSDMKENCITIHKLLEYQPVPYEVYDEATCTYRMSMRFEPTRNKMNPLPSSIKTIVIDESSMVSVELFTQLSDACPHKPQFIYIGDLQQLPPVFGSAILGFKILECPTTQLDTVYRQALESPIIALATFIRRGESFPLYKERTTTEHPTQGKVTIHPWKKKISSEDALRTAAAFFKAAYDNAQYNPEEDQILIPFNKACGSIELNKHIANHIAKRENREVYEIIAGYNKHYFSVGDLVLFDKEDARIIDINRNGTYIGKRPQKESPTLDYWGYNSTHQQEKDIDSIDDIDHLLTLAASDEEKVNVSSHTITVEMLDSGEEVTLDTSAEVNSLLLAYALTVHKSQGSEWERVFLVFHSSHATMLQRELLYTAVTRAKQELYIICEPDTFQKGVQSQKVKGTTLEEKAAFFKGKLDSSEYTLTPSGELS